MTATPPPLPPYAATPIGETPGKAIAALVCGILGITLCGCFPLGIAAWVLGKQAERQIAASQGRLGGASLAKAGWITGIIGTIGGAIYMLALTGLVVVSVWTEVQRY